MKVFGVIQIDAAADTQSAALPRISAIPRPASVPLSLRQQQLWFVSRLKGGSEDCHVHTMLRLRGQLDEAVLQSALDGLVARHEVLRTTFGAQDGEPFQKIGPAHTGLRLRRDHLAGAADLEAALSELVSREVEVPFDLELSPLIRARLVRLAVDDHALVITHQMVSDTWSRNILTRDLCELYNAFRENCADRFKVLPVQYADYALWRHRWVSGQVLQRQSECWRRILVGAPAVLELPTGRPRSSRPDHYGGDVEFTRHPVLTDQIKALSRNLGTSLFVMLLSAWVLVLARLSGRDELVIGTPGANRAYCEIEGLIGLFVNPLALRIDLSGDPTLEILVERVQAAAMGAKAHQDLPFEQVLKLVNSSRTLAHSPIFRGAFACENNVIEPAELGGLKLECVNPCVRFAQHDLALTLMRSNAEFRGRLFYATALLERSTIERFADVF
ncbi:condensation domain-containing protein [Bradyrhizobium cytisi]|uniref:Condensation domain-containing protein n=1 Tax=Bradyrhizobium cytisi TaxID=515489 RepID=A0A5S4WCS9_9BRAD|nr:condensation domain-containing protein [Bradyrhizobium cytisi]TYL72420.1 hypothetical protein FXB38_38575 [Bradyrhizobium cytisi]